LWWNHIANIQEIFEMSKPDYAGLFNFKRDKFEGHYNLILLPLPFECILTHIPHIQGVFMRRLAGVILVLISAVCFGVTPILAHMAFQAGSTPVTVLLIRVFIGAVILSAIMRIEARPLPDRKTLLGLAGLGALGYVGQSFMYFTALTLASTSLVALILYLYPGLVTIFSVLLFKEKLTPVKAGALILATGGAALTVGPIGVGQPLGIILAFGAAVIYSLYILAGSRLFKRATAVQGSTVILVAAFLAYACIAAWQGLALPLTDLGWMCIGGVALAGTLGIITFFTGLQRVGPANGATLSTAEPVTTVLLTGLILHESLTPVRLLGGVLILTAVILLARGEIARPAQVAFEVK
jgi:drug/metabolite transporter (DMT)-like permease